MAWSGGNLTVATAGSLITILDAGLVVNSHWTIHDSAAGTNCKVYECQDDKVNCHFFVKVDDNYSGYAIIELWEDWNATSHAGVGRSRTLFSSTYTFRINRSSTVNQNGWFLSVKDHYFIYVNCGEYWSGTYIGRPKLFDESRNVVLFCGASTGANLYNNLGYFPNDTGGGLAFLFDHKGQASLGAMTEGASSSITRYSWTPFGDALASEVWIRNTVTSDLVCIGALDGVLQLGGSQVVNGKLYDLDGTKWLGVVGYGSVYGTLIRMD